MEEDGSLVALALALSAGVRIMDGCDVYTELHIVYYRLGRCSLSSLQVVVGQAGNGSTSAAGSCSRRSRCPTGHGGRWLTVMQGGESAEPIAVSDNPSKPWVR